MPRIEPIPSDPNANAIVNNQLARTLGRQPDILRAFAKLDKAARFGGTLPLELKEAARRATACEVGCAYCSSLGTVGDGLDERTSLAVRFARAIAADPAGIDDALFEELRGQFTDDEIVELTAFISLVGIAGQIFGAVMELEAAPEEEIAAYGAVLQRRY